MKNMLSGGDLSRIDRRLLLAGGAAALVVAASVPAGSRIARAANANFEPNALIRIGADGKITLIMRDATDKDYGIGDWSDQQIADYLSFGHAAGRGSASGPMGEAVGNSLQYLTADDTHSLVLYLRHVEPQTGVPGTEVDPAPGTMTASSTWAPGTTDDQSELGRRLFEGVCASCHAYNGGGRETNYAALAGSQAVNDPVGENLVRVLLSGGDLKTSHGTAYMPSFASAYNDAELAAVSNYVIGHFGGKTGHVTPELVKKRRAQQ